MNLCRSALPWVLLLAAPALGVPRVVINEIQYHDADPIEELEYVELLNAGDAPADLEGWSFVRGIDFVFPPGTTIPPGGYLVVARDAAAVRAVYGLGDEVIGDFGGELADGGERVRLVDARGAVASEVRYDDDDPWPTQCDGGGPSLERVGPDRPEDRASTWRTATAPGWRRVEWHGLVLGGRGYLYFTTEGEAFIDDLTLVLVDDPDRNRVENGGFDAGIDGFSLGTSYRQSVWDPGEGHGAPGAFRVVATRAATYPSAGVRFGLSPRPVDGAEYVMRFWLKPVRGEVLAGGAAVAGTNTGGLPRTIRSTPLASFGTPGRPNSLDPADAPPFIGSPWLGPRDPTSDDAVTVSVPIEDEGPIASARLGHTELWGAFEEIPLRDDGVDPDPLAGDRIFTARIPPARNHRFVRYWIKATDGTGHVARRPDPGEAFPYLAYFVDDGDADDSDLPALWLFIPTQDLSAMNANPYSNVYHTATLVWDGTVYDSIRVRYRGGSVRNHPKKFYKVKFNRGRRLEGRRTINLNSEYPDYSRIRTHIAYIFFERAGLLSCESDFYRLYLNTQYYGVYLALEDPEEEFLERQRREGALYKSYSTDTRPSSLAEYYTTYRKQSEQHESYGELVDFVTRLNSLSGAALQDFVHETINVDQVARFCAVNSVLGNLDWGHKNHYLFRDRATGLWEFTPWDVDLTMGKNWPPCRSVFCHDGQYNQSVIMGLQGTSVFNKMADAVLRDVSIQDRVKRIIKEIMTTDFTPEKMNAWVDALYDLISDETIEEIRRFRSFPQQMTEAQYWQQRDAIKQWVVQRRGFVLPQLLLPVRDLAYEALEGNRVRLTWIPDAGTEKVRIRVDRRTAGYVDVEEDGRPMAFITDPLAEGRHEICVYGMVGSRTTSPVCIDVELVGIAPVADLACELAEVAGPPRAPGAQLTWRNVGTYDEVAFWVSTGGSWESAGAAAGDAESAVVAVPSLDAAESFSVRAAPRRDGTEGPPAECRVDVVLPPPFALECFPFDDGRRALISWADGDIPGGGYDAVEVLLDGEVLDVLSPPPSPAVYRTPVIPSSPDPRHLAVRGVWFGRRTDPAGSCEVVFDYGGVLFRRGDVDADGDLTIGDAVGLLGVLFAGAAEPPCRDAADIDDSGAFEIGDAIGLLNYLFAGGQPPRDPGPITCGVDPTPDDGLDCAAFPPCGP